MAAAAAGRAERQEAAGRALKRGTGLPGWGASSEQRSCWAIWPATRMYVCWEGVGGGNYGEGGVVSMGAMITVCVCVCGPPPNMLCPSPLMSAGGPRLYPLPPALHLPPRHRGRAVESQPDQSDAVPQPLGLPPLGVQGARKGAAAAASRGQHQVQGEETGALPVLVGLPSPGGGCRVRVRVLPPLQAEGEPGGQCLLHPLTPLDTPLTLSPIPCRSQRWWSTPSHRPQWMQSP